MRKSCCAKFLVMKLGNDPTDESYTSWQLCDADHTNGLIPRSDAVGSTLYGQRKDAEDMRHLILATACHNKQVFSGILGPTGQYCSFAWKTKAQLMGSTQV